MKMQREKSKVYRYLSRHMFATVLSLVLSFFTVIAGSYLLELDYPQIDFLYQNQNLKFLFGNLIYIVLGLILAFAIIFPILAKTLGKMFGVQVYKYLKITYLLLLIISSFFLSKYLLDILNTSVSLIIIFLFIYIFIALFFVLYLVISISFGKFLKSRK